MSGSATFTIVTSSRSMKVPTATATRVHHLRSIATDVIVNLPNHVVSDL